MFRLPLVVEIAAPELVELTSLKVHPMTLRLEDDCEMNPPTSLPPLMNFKLFNSTLALTVNILFLLASKVTAPVPLFLMVTALLSVLPFIISV